MLSRKEVAEHNTLRSCWVIIANKAYDVTDFIKDHPGGEGAILRWAGQDATEEYVPIHPPNALDESLSLDKHLGLVELEEKVEEDASVAKPVPQFENDDVPLELCQNLLDIEAQAGRKLSERSFTYFHSAADSLHALEANRKDWTKLSFRPRVLRNVAQVSMTCEVMGVSSRLPIFISPMAMIKLADKDGEIALARAASVTGIPHAVSTYSSCSHEEIMQYVKAAELLQMQVFQLYVPRKIESAIKLIKSARRLRFKALLVTVDTPVVGKREEDDHFKARVQYQSGVEDTPRTADTLSLDERPILRGVHSSTLNWKDLGWIREAWGNSGPIILKGIQSAEDALLAFEAGVDGIYLSNHGGRQLDFAPSSLSTLLEIRAFCPEIIGKIHIYLDGGVRRGSDILKALCLGATAVGLGRPFVYALGAYGQKGVERAVELLSDELETTMRLLGVTELADLRPYYVNTKRLDRQLVDTIYRRPRQDLAKARL